MGWLKKALKFIGNSLTLYAVPILEQVFNTISNADTNKSNRQIADQNNQTQIQLANQKWDRDVQMWNMQNEYNSPENQSARLRAAGLNPFMQGVTAGIAQTSPSAPMAQMQNGAPQQALNFDFSKIMQLPLLKEQIKAQQLANEGTMIDNKYKEAMTKEMLNNLIYRNNGQVFQNDLLKLDYDFNKETYQNRVEMVAQELSSKVLENKQAEIHLKFLPQEKRLGVKLLAANLSRIAIENNLTRVQIHNLYTQNNFIQQQIDGLKLDNKEKQLVQKFVERTAYYNMQQAGALAGKTYWDAVHSRNNSNPDNAWQKSFQHGRLYGSIVRGLSTTGSIISPFK